MEELKEGDDIGEPKYVHAYTPPAIVDATGSKYNRGHNDKVHSPFILYGTKEADKIDLEDQFEKAYIVNNEGGVKAVIPFRYHPLSLVLGLSYVLLRVTYSTLTAFTSSQWPRQSLCYRQWVLVPADPNNFETTYSVPLDKIRRCKQTAIGWYNGISGVNTSQWTSEITYSYTRPITFYFDPIEGFQFLDYGGFTVIEPGATNNEGEGAGPAPPGPYSPTTGHGGSGSGERTPIPYFVGDVRGAYCRWLNFTDHFYDIIYPVAKVKPFNYGQDSIELVNVGYEGSFTGALPEGKYVDYIGEDESRNGFSVKFVDTFLGPLNGLYNNPRKGEVADDGTITTWSQKWEYFDNEQTVP